MVVLSRSAFGGLCSAQAAADDHDASGWLLMASLRSCQPRWPVECEKFLTGSGSSRTDPMQG